MKVVFKTDNGRLIQGDNVEVMKKLVNNSIDSCISDFPYNLSFMGKKWDTKNNFYDWCKERAVELQRIIKPGGYVCIFGHPKTNHRMKCAFEDVGFNIVEEIDWVYGCLSDDTEILTQDGWKNYEGITYGDKILSWDSKNEVLEFNKVDDLIIKEYQGDMVSFKNDDTDQLLTPNHRVYQKQRIRKMTNGNRKNYFEKNWNVKIAEDINRWNTINLPLSSYHNGLGIGGEKYAELLGWIWSEGEFDKVPHGVRLTQSSVNQEYVNKINELFKTLNIVPKIYKRERSYKNKKYVEFIWFLSGEIARRIRLDLPNKKLHMTSYLK